MNLESVFETGLFEGLPPEQVASLANIAKLQNYRKGDPIFFEGDECEGFFVIKSGRVKVFKTSLDGKEQILHWFEEGDRFAEAPAFDGGCYPASASALEKTELVFFPKALLVELVQQHPTLALNMLANLSRHLRRFAKLIDNLSLKEVPSRLAVYLLHSIDRSSNAEIARKQSPDQTQASSPTRRERGKGDTPKVTQAEVTTIYLELTKGQLAAFLGTIPETLSRTFAKLSQEGILEIEGSQVTVLDLDRLEQLASGDKTVR
ncbi:MAG: Crp/Fnr family transcriptional regulator [Cyanobacteria bacterium SID2]|nr:Crp/Fnr family transcriptional regulator [Cyanobacteria bacterium SID2]